MIGEISCAINRVEEQIEQLFDEKETGLPKLKLLEANFIWSEEHSKRIFIKVKVEKMLNEKVSIQQSFKAEFKEIYT